MNANVPGIVVGSVARSYDGKTYYRATAKTADGLISFKMHERPASGANVLLDIYKVGEQPEFMDEKLKSDLAVCKLENFDIEVLKTADELLNEIKDIVLG